MNHLTLAPHQVKRGEIEGKRRQAYAKSKGYRAYDGCWNAERGHCFGVMYEIATGLAYGVKKYDAKVGRLSKRDVGDMEVKGGSVFNFTTYLAYYQWEIKRDEVWTETDSLVHRPIVCVAALKNPPHYPTEFAICGWIMPWAVHDYCRFWSAPKIDDDRYLVPFAQLQDPHLLPDKFRQDPQ